ncbi:MAG: hypothetical protein AAGF11_18445 [Myxococcota bacterium]
MATLAVIPEILVDAVASIVGIGRFMSEARVLVRAVANVMVVVVVCRWQGACNPGVLAPELDRGAG